MEQTQIDFINYRSLFKNDYKKGVKNLERILLDKTQAKAFVNDPAGVAVIFAFDRNNPDKNALELYDMLGRSEYANTAANTLLSQYVDFNSDTIGDDLAELLVSNQEVFNAMFVSYELLAMIFESSTATDILINSDEFMEYADKFVEFSGDQKELSFTIVCKTISLLAGLNPDDYETSYDWEADNFDDDDYDKILESKPALRAFGVFGAYDTFIEMPLVTFTNYCHESPFIKNIPSTHEMSDNYFNNISVNGKNMLVDVRYGSSNSNYYKIDNNNAVIFESIRRICEFCKHNFEVYGLENVNITRSGTWYIPLD